MEMIYVLDVMGNDVIKRGVIQSKSIVELNQWIAFYVNDGYLPQIRIVNEYEKPSVLELGIA